MDTNLKRKLARGVAVLSIALGAGQLVQSMSDSSAKKRIAHSESAQKARNIETVAAGADAVKPNPEQPNPALAAPKLPEAEPKAQVASTAPAVPTAPVEPSPAATPVLASQPAAPAPQPEVAKADPCANTFELSAGQNAMIGLTLISPCHPGERVVLKHGGLAVTGRIPETGALFVDIPALEQPAEVEVMFKDGSRISQVIDMPELADLRRVGLQWQADDAFSLHAFEDGAAYGSAGDISAANLNRPAAGLAAKGGFLTLLGDGKTDLPLLAQVYTYPADPNAKVDVVIEAAVTEVSCGREILAETIASTAGKVEIGDLSAAMPGCDAVGDYLVLKNLVPDMNIAAN